MPVFAVRTAKGPSWDYSRGNREQAFWDPWRDVHNGKGLIEDIASNIIKMIVNQDFSSGLEPGPLLDYFPVPFPAAGGQLIRQRRFVRPG